MPGNPTAGYGSFALRQNGVFALEAQGARTDRVLEPTLPSVYTALYDGRRLFGQKDAF